MPKLLNPELKKRMLSQIRRGSSINKISNSLGLGKSTIYYHYKQIRGKKYSPPNFKLSASEVEGEIVGIFAGDGSQYLVKSSYNYQVNVHFGKKNYWYALHVKELFERVV